MKVVHPEGWALAKGYVNGALCEGGRVLYVAGQIAWDASQKIVSDDFVAQFDQCLANVIAVVHAAGGSPQHIVKMTVYVTDIDAYRRSLREVGQRWKEHVGMHFPAMALVGVAALVEPEAKIEIEAIAHLGETP
jgi:enamine deaminase RidA (YjgF/YER057c/UK114 family)